MSSKPVTNPPYDARRAVFGLATVSTGLSFLSMWVCLRSNASPTTKVAAAALGSYSANHAFSFLQAAFSGETTSWGKRFTKAISETQGREDQLIRALTKPFLTPREKFQGSVRQVITANKTRGAGGGDPHPSTAELPPAPGSIAPISPPLRSLSKSPSPTNVTGMQRSGSNRDLNGWDLTGEEETYRS